MGIDRKAAVISAIRHQETQFCPYTFNWAPDSDIAERLDVHYGSSKWRTSFRSYIVRCGDVDDGRHVYEEGPPVRTDHFGSVWRTDLKPIHLEVPVLKKPSLHGYTFPDIDLLVPKNWEQNAHKSISENNDCFTVICPGSGIFERSWALRGFAELLTDCAAEPEFFADLIAAMAEFYDRLLDRLLEFPVDGIYFGDDWGDQRAVMIGPQRWRKVLKPHYARLYAKVKKAGKFVLSHCCGSIADIIPDVIEIGLDVLESVQSEAHNMNPYELKDRFADQLTFWGGGVNTQKTLPFGTPQEVRDEVACQIETFAPGGGFVFCSVHNIQAKTPVENLIAMFETLETYTKH